MDKNKALHNISSIKYLVPVHQAADYHHEIVKSICCVATPRKEYARFEHKSTMARTICTQTHNSC